MWVPKAIYVSVEYITVLADQETGFSALCATLLTLGQIL